MSDFLSEFETFTNEVSQLSGHAIILGDFNMHVDNPSKSDVAQFLSIIESADLVQHVNGPTQRMGHTLDLIMTRKGTSSHLSLHGTPGASFDECLIRDVTIHENLLSDHHCIRFQLSLPSLKRHKIQRSVRKFKEMDIKGFTELLQDKLTELPETTDVNTILTAYNSATSECLDKSAPRKTCSRSTRPRNPWFNENIQIACRIRRRAERKWRKNPSEANRSEFTDAIKNVNESIIHAKKDYLMETLDNADNRKVFQTLNHLLQRNIKVLQAHNCPLQLANSFAQYFKEKIMKIRESLTSNVCTNANTVYDIDNNCCIDLKDQLSEFDTITEENVRNIVMKMSASSCQLDPQPTWLLKKCLSYNLNSVTRIVNASLQPGVFPSPAHDSHHYSHH